MDIKSVFKGVKKKGDELYSLLEILGEGAYGRVFRAVGKNDGKTYAIKVIRCENEPTDVMKEIEILKNCDSQYVIKYFDSFISETDKNLWIVLEYCGGGSVSELLRVLDRPLTEEHIASIAKSTVEGLAYLHSQRKIHRDIKPGNILLTETGDVKLADFGVSKQLTNSLSRGGSKNKTGGETFIGTPYYMAPEVITAEETGKYQPNVDVWSLGILLIELAEMKPPLSEIHPLRAIFLIPTRPSPRLRNEKKWSKEFVDFLSKCLTKSPLKRPNSYDLLDHPFIKKAKPNFVLQSMVDQLKNVFSSHGGREKYYKQNRQIQDNDTLEDDTYVDVDTDTETSDDSYSDGESDDDVTLKRTPTKKTNTIVKSRTGSDLLDSPLHTPPSEKKRKSRKKKRKKRFGHSTLDETIVPVDFKFDKRFVMPDESVKTIPIKEYVIAFKKNDIQIDDLKKLKKTKYFQMEFKKKVEILDTNRETKERALQVWLKFLEEKNNK